MKSGRYAFIFLLCLAGCSTAPEISRRDSPHAEKKTAVKEPPRHLPGSLWSEDSRWNDMYNEAPSRFVGDIVTVKLSDSLKARLLAKAKKAGPKTEARKPAAETPGKGAKKGPVVAAAPPDAAPTEKTSAQAPTVLHATIREIQPRGIVVLSASETVRVGDDEPKVTLEGKVRDRDIDSDDSVGSDSILNLSLKVEGVEASKVASSADPSPESKPEASGLASADKERK